uniref:Uncharacterized protein n=1 Tax=Arundo donax TaxID=35708 RepID=A0A0A9AHE2_ARUDO
MLYQNAPNRLMGYQLNVKA